MNILAIGAHPDDLEINCYGTLARYIQRGDYVCCTTVANGSLGHMTIPQEELREIRRQECIKAAAVIGAEYIAINCNDMTVDYYNEDARKRLVDVIRYSKPDVIITHNPMDYMNDHTETNRLVFYASFASTLPHYISNEPVYPEVVPIYYMESSGGLGFIPEEYVDITDTFDLKYKAMRCHESQLKWLADHDNEDVLSRLRIVASYRGMQSKTTYAEGFRRCNASGRMTTARLLP